MRSRFLLALLIIQSIFCLLHFFLYETLVGLVWEPSYGPLRRLRIVFVILSFVFVAASVLAFFANNLILRVFYTLAALWTGLGSFLFWAAVASWFVAETEVFTNLPLHTHRVAEALLVAGTLAAIAAAVNAEFPRMPRYTVNLANLPEVWRGRTAALVSDLHLGHVHHLGFSRRIVRMVDRANPDLVLIAGDFYDGTKVDLELMVSPWRRLKPQFGIYFSSGNHEEFRHPEEYLDALRSVGIRVLDGEKVLADGLQIAGVHHHETVHADSFRAALAKADIDRALPSILISHSPHRLNIPEQAGISLQVSGHTHGGQIWPYTWLTDRIFGEYVHGLHRFGEMQVLTSYGAGTWGPPMRLGTTPEIILIEFA